MAKRSKQRPARQKKDHSGCMWGLISMFDFRHGRATRRMLSNQRRYPTNNNHGSSYPTSEANSPTNSQQIHLRIEDGKKVKKPSFDLVTTRVKELIEEEMFVDQESKSTTKDHEQTNGSKTLKKSFDQEISFSHDLEGLVKEILLIYQKKNEQHGDLEPGAKRSFPIIEEKKLIAAVEVLLNEKSTNGDHEKIHDSKEMFQMLSSNKEMFLKLLQDQNSILLNEDQKSKSKSTNQESEEPVTHKHRKFFRRRSKSQESISLNGKDRIVILKPGSSENQNEIHSEGNGSLYSFMEIKRRLKNAMGKEQQTPGPGPGPTWKTVVDGGWSSPNRDHFYTERFARITNGLKPGDRVSKLREPGMINDNLNNRVSNIYVEAKKHLSEMLTSGEDDAESKSMLRSLPRSRSLGGILSFREYKYLSPATSPRARDDLHMVNKSQPSTINDNPEEKVVVLDDVTCAGVQEIVKSPSCDDKHKEQTESFDVLCEPNGPPICVDENESSSSRTHVEHSPASKIEEVEISSGDRTGKPSPISVLEPFFSDDDISPAKTVSRAAEAAVQPICIQFDESVQQIRITDSGDNEESAFEYIEAVLLSSDLNWPEFEKRWLSSLQILDPLLFDEVESFSGRPIYDQKLLFDSTNKALEDVCDRYIPESSLIKQNVWPVPKGMDLINEVWTKLESCLYKVYPRDLNKLVRNDLETSRIWFDLRPGSRQIVNEIEELIFKEMIDDTVLSLFNDCS